MDLDLALEKCRSLLRIKGFLDWRVEVTQSLDYAGMTKYSERCIRLSEPILSRLDEWQVRDVVLHEVAHAIAGGFVETHGDVWVKAHKRLGGSGLWYIDVPQDFKQQLRRQIEEE